LPPFSSDAGSAGRSRGWAGVSLAVMPCCGSLLATCAKSCPSSWPVTPGGAGTQQVLVAFALHGTVSTAAALSFSAGMQVGITAVNTLVGMAALMLIFRTLRPVEAVRAARRRANP
jgi:NhaP-type Na+/H+ or K+/H+ antiporter